MALLALIIYTRVRVVRPFVCANCVRVYMIERAFIYMRAFTCIRVSLHLFTRKNSFLCAFVCVSSRGFN